MLEQLIIAEAICLPHLASRDGAILAYHVPTTQVALGFVARVGKHAATETLREAGRASTRACTSCGDEATEGVPSA